MRYEMAPPDPLHLGGIVARSARPCGVLLPHLLLVEPEDGLDELIAVPDLQGGPLEVDVDPATRAVSPATDLVPGHRDDPVGGDPAGDPPVPGPLADQGGGVHGTAR